MLTFPVTESTASAAHLASFLQESYNLSPNTTCNLLRTGMNHLYRVEDGDERFVFRLYSFQWRTKKEITEEVRLLAYLKQNSLPVSYPILGKGGEVIQEINMPEGVRYGVLFSFAEGKKNPRLPMEVCYNVGSTMARMHELTRDFPFERVAYNAKTLLQDSFKKTSRFFGITSEEMCFIARLGDHLLEQYAAINASEVSFGVVHLDIWFDNLHITESNSITLFDFDFAGVGYQSNDIAYFLMQLFNTHPNEEEYLPKAEQFLKGYESIRKITKEEKRLLPYLSLGAMLFYLSIQCERFDTWSNIFLNEDHLKRFVASLKRWMAYNKVNPE